MLRAWLGACTFAITLTVTPAVTQPDHLRLYASAGPLVEDFEGAVSRWRTAALGGSAQSLDGAIVPVDVSGLARRQAQRLSGIVSDLVEKMARNADLTASLTFGDGSEFNVHLARDAVLFQATAHGAEGANPLFVADTDPSWPGHPADEPRLPPGGVGRQSLGPIELFRPRDANLRAPFSPKLYCPFASSQEECNRQRPWHTVALSRQIVPTGPDEFSYCTGVLVAPRFVLTAAHCVCPLASPAGLSRLDKDGLFQHPNYAVFLNVLERSHRRPIRAKRPFFFEHDGLDFCNSGASGDNRNRMGDIALVELERDAVADVGSSDHFRDAGGELIGQRLLAPVAAPDAQIWRTGRRNVFVTIGVGQGLEEGHTWRRDSAAPLHFRRRFMGYALSHLDDFDGGVSLATFSQTGRAICHGDSGSGFFKPAIVNGQPTLSLVAIASKFGLQGRCFDGQILAVDIEPATAVRIDTSEVHKWLVETTGGTVQFTKPLERLRLSGAD